MTNEYIVGWLRRTAKVCYILGIWLIIVVIATYAIAFQAASEVVYSGLSLHQAFEPYISLILGLSVVSAILSILFSVGTIKIGQNYSSAAFVFVGVIYLLSTIMSLVLSPLAIASTDAMVEGGQLVTTRDPTVSLFTTLNEVIQLIAYIGLIIASFTMKQKTDVGTFTAVGVLTIIGVLIGYLIPIAIIILGGAFSQTASKPRVAQPTLAQIGQQKYAPPYSSERTPAEPVEPGEHEPGREGASPVISAGDLASGRCPYCGAKVRLDDLFCAACGSSLKQRREG
jgi:hypothetical protein